MTFKWLEPGKVAGCRGPRTESDLDDLRSLGVKAIVRLAAESSFSAAQVEAAGLRHLMVPVNDLAAPTISQIESIISFVRSCIAMEEPVAISCGAGYGRTGTVLACYLVGNGASVESALDGVGRIGKSPETDAQRRIITAFRASLP